MAYQPKSIMDVWDIIRRWHERQGIREISRATGFDRKTIKSYKRLAESAGLSVDEPLPEKEEVQKLLMEHDERSSPGRTPRAQTLLLPYLDEIRGLINPDRPDLALKAKSAFLVLCERHPNLVGSVSYSSYKRFVHLYKLSINPKLATCRIEVEPGSEVQIDYAKMCRFYDPERDRQRILYGFIATLSHSRMKYVELVFGQDQSSFVGSHIRMYEFFGGVTRRNVIDNLKAGVIKPNLYEPSLNRSYREMIEHYGGFVDTARVRHPKDKGKVERDVQTVREAVRILIVQNPIVGLAELNRLIKDWCINTYGNKEHGTTHEKPYEVFLQREKPALKPLPAEPFKVAVWKQATVHPDHYIQFRSQTFSVPHAYLGKTVWIRASERILQVFFNDKLIKTHIITRGYRHTDFDDFPENVIAALDQSSVHKGLLENAQSVGPAFHRLIHSLLSAHAYINLRMAQGFIRISKASGDPRLIEQSAELMERHGIKVSLENFRRIIGKINAEAATPQSVPVSEATREYIRDITYFINNERQN
jgi:transposase